MTEFASLEPLQIGRLTVRNRILQPAHAKLFSQQAADTRRDLQYHGARALLVTRMRERIDDPSRTV